LGAMQRLSAWRDDKSSTKMTAGSIKRRRMKHKIIVDQENVHDDTARSQVSQASRVLKSPISAQRSSPLSAPRVSPVALSHAQPNALFSPVKSKSELKHFFKRERIKKVKSILKSTRSLPNVKEGRSPFPFLRYTTISKRGAKQKKVRWADPLVQIVHPVDSPLKHDARPRSISADSPDAINLLGRNGRTASRCKNATRQSKAAFFSNPKSRAPNSRSDIDRSRPTTKCEAPRSPPTSTSRPPPRSPPPPTSKQSRKAYASRRETLSLVFSQRKGMVRPSSVRPNARTRSSQSFTLIDSKGGVDREQINMSIMGYPRKKPIRKPQDGRRKCVNQFSTNKSRRSYHRQSTPFTRNVIH